MKHSDAVLRETINKIIAKRPVFQWNDGEKVRNNYRNLIQYNEALERYVTESHAEILGLLDAREKELLSLCVKLRGKPELATTIKIGEVLGGKGGEE